MQARSGDTRGRGQRSFGVTCLGMKSAGTKASFRTKVRAPWGSEVSEFGVVGVVWSSSWQKVPGCLRRREFKEEGDCKVQGRQLEAWTSPLATRGLVSQQCVRDSAVSPNPERGLITQVLPSV